MPNAAGPPVLGQRQHDPAERVDDDAEAEGAEHRELGRVGEALADLALYSASPDARSLHACSIHSTVAARRATMPNTNTTG